MAILLPDVRGGGAERVALRLAQDFVQADFAVDLILMERRGELLDLVPAQVQIIDLGAKRIRNAILPLIRYFRNGRPRAIQVSMWPLTIAAILAHRISRSPARIVLSDHIMLSKQYGSLGPIAFWLMRMSIRFFYPLAHARVIVSAQAGQDLAQISGIARDSIDVIYNPVAEPPPDAQTTSGIDPSWRIGSCRILTVGSFKEQKNHALLIKSFGRLARVRSAQLTILGEGPLRQQLTTLAAAEGVGDLVSMPGFSSNPWPYYASADLFVLSSDYEGYPLVLIEAMRCGLRIVSTDCESGPREILGDGAYGILVPCGDVDAFSEAMANALDQPPPSKSHLMARAEALSGQNTADSYLALMLADH